MLVSEVLENTVMAGKIMLESGAEIYRVEETISIMALNCGMEEAEAFVLPTGIMVSVKKDGITNSKISRIRHSNIDLNKIDAINALSRKIGTCQMSSSAIKKTLQAIDNTPKYDAKILLLASGLGASGHVLLFGGKLLDIPLTFIGGIIIYFVAVIANKFRINFFIHTLLAAFLVTVFQLSFPWHQDVDMVIICSLMLLVPGLAITNAIRDSVAKDLVAALSRLLETVLIACAIALGVILAIWLTGVIK